MSETLVRIPLSGQSGFHPQALAPGLPMLDAKKLTYQVLLGWFGDLLAEPQLDEDGVAFHVQTNGQRIRFLDRQLATQQDLEGPLAQQFERLKKALFDVRPVSPSERLIFNRLQPPIGNHSGYLYRVHTEDGADRLVWCWGFQRRTKDGNARLCPNSSCSLLLIEQDEALQNCPRCDVLLSSTPNANSRSRFPLGAFAAAIVLTSLAGGTYWYAAHAGDRLPDGLPDLGFQLPGSSKQANRERQQDTADEDVSANASDTIAAKEPLPITLPEKVKTASNEGADGETSREIGETSNQDNGSFSEKTDQGEARNLANNTGSNVGNSAENTPKIRLPHPDSVGDTFAGAPKSSSSDNPHASQPLKWHTDYLTAYKEALDNKKALLMVFRTTVDETSNRMLRTSLSQPEIAHHLKDYVRVILPVDLKVPGANGAEPQRLLAHRSFRHLGVRPGMVIVDLRNPGTKLYGRAVSALPQPASGQYSKSVVATLLRLPKGNIQQRSLMLAIRSEIGTRDPDSSFLTTNLTPTLNVLANRNVRYMAHFGQIGTFDDEYRVSQVATQFGDAAEVSLLVWGTGESLSLQEACRAAVHAWLSDPSDYYQLASQFTAAGVDIIQDPNTGHWYATCLIVRQ